MKTVFYVNCADFGSTGKIIRTVARVLKTKGWDSILCAATLAVNDPVFEEQFVVSNRLRRAVVYRLSRITGNRYGFCWFTTLHLIRKILRQKPEVVHIHCANGSFINIYLLMRCLKKNKIATVVTNHAEFFYTGNCDHACDCEKWRSGCEHCSQNFSLFDTTKRRWNAMRKAFRGFPKLVVTSVSPWVLSRCTASLIMNGVQQRLVENGVDTSVFHMYENNDVWQRYGFQTEGKRVVLYVTAHFYGESLKKGSKYLLELARRFVGDDVVFAVAGTYVQNIDLPENVRLLGRISNQDELAKMYSAADLTLITSQRETFSMPVVEAMCCGTPVVGFQAGGPESIAIREFSEFVEFSDVDALESIMRTKWLSFKNPESSEKICQAATTRYCEVKMAKEYLAIYEALTGAATNEAK